MGGESKLVVFGSGGVGKSAITVKFVQGKFVEQYDPSICDKYRKQEVIDGETEIIEVVDTAGQEEYKSMRAQYYQKGEGFIAVYSITDRSSMGEVEKLRDDVLEEKGCNWVPMVLVGSKCDLEAQRKVTTPEGEALAKHWFGKNKGIPFFETSAKDAINIDETFHQIVRELRAQKARGGPPAQPVPRPPPPGVGPAACTHRTPPPAVSQMPTPEAQQRVKEPVQKVKEPVKEPVQKVKEPVATSPANNKPPGRKRRCAVM